VLGIAEHDRELGKLRGELIRDDVPLCARGFGRLLGERRADEREDHLPLALAGVNQPACRTFTYVASIHRYGESPSSGRLRNTPTRSPMSPHNRDT